MIVFRPQIVRLTRSLAAGLALVLAGAAAAQTPPLGAREDGSDYFKVAGNFLKNCDARKNAAGERPPENYLCLSYVAGLLEGYTVGAIASGNRRPYCLPRPVTLVEMMDLMATAIERGVPPETPTATVVHNLLAVSFPCADTRARPDAEPPQSGEGEGDAEAQEETRAPSPDGETEEDRSAGLPMAPDAPVVGAPEPMPDRASRPSTPLVEPEPEPRAAGLPMAPDAPVVGAPERGGRPDQASTDAAIDADAGTDEDADGTR